MGKKASGRKQLQTDSAKSHLSLIYVTLLKKASLRKHFKLNTQLLKKILEPRPPMAWFIRQYIINVFVCLSTPFTGSLQLFKSHATLHPATVLTKALSVSELIVGLKKQYFLKRHL